MPELFPVRYSLPDASALTSQVLPYYDLPGSPCCQLLQVAQSGGNDLYLVTAESTQYVLRVYLVGVRTASTLAQDADLLAQLAASGVPVVTAIPQRDGAFVREIRAPEGLRPVLLTEWVPGNAPHGGITPEQSAAYGRAAAQLHLAADRIPQPSTWEVLGADELVSVPTHNILHFLSQRPSDATWLGVLAARLTFLLTLLPMQLPAWGICHGDLHKSNLLCTADGGLTVIDFDCAGYGWRAYDLAVFRWSVARPEWMGGLEPARAEAVWGAFIGAYSHLRSISTVEQEAIDMFVLIRHLWWLAIDLRKIRSGLEPGRWLNDDYWDRHLAAVRKWADAIPGCGSTL